MDNSLRSFISLLREVKLSFGFQFCVEIYTISGCTGFGGCKATLANIVFHVDLWPRRNNSRVIFYNYFWAKFIVIQGSSLFTRAMFVVSKDYANYFLLAKS